MLQQLRKGLELHGLVDQMTTNPEACHPLFVPGKITKVTFFTARNYNQFLEKEEERAGKQEGPSFFPALFTSFFFFFFF